VDIPGLFINFSENPVQNVIGDLPVNWSSSHWVDILEPLEIDASALAFPSNPQQLLWDELAIELFVDFSKNFVQNIRVALAQLTAMDSDS
jgi:hypothetical protein